MDANGVSTLVAICVSLCILVVLFIALREVMLWYWKVNHIVAWLQSIDKKLDHQNITIAWLQSIDTKLGNLNMKEPPTAKP